LRDELHVHVDILDAELSTNTEEKVGTTTENARGFLTQ